MFVLQQIICKLCGDFIYPPIWPGWDWRGDLCRPDIFFAVERYSFEGNLSDFYHVCTDGASLDWLFKDDSDFIAGVNRTGICAVVSGVKLVSFVLMDNHVHFILYGDMPSCKDFILRYKNLTGRYIYSKYGLKEYTHTLPAEIIRIDSIDRLVTTVAYLDRNPIVAGWGKMPDEYRWGVSRFIFRTQWGCEKFRNLDTLSFREQRVLLGTHVRLPQDWRVDESGMLDVRCFVDVAFLEKLFRSPGRYLYFLSRKLEGAVDQFFTMGTKTFVLDKDLRFIVEKLAKEHYGERDIRLLNVNARLHIARKLRYEYASTVKQISRMLHLDIDMLKGFV